MVGPIYIAGHGEGRAAVNSDPRTVTAWLTRAIAYVAYAFLLVSEFILLQGFLLQLLGANPDADYTQWAYRSLDRVMAPFRGIFTPVELEGDAVLDTSIMFAMVIYLIAILVVRAFLDWLTYRLDKMEYERSAEVASRAETAGTATDSGASSSSDVGSEAPRP